MKKIAISSLLYFSLLLVGFPAQAKQIWEMWDSSEGDFYTTFWLEKGEDEGTVGNEFLALGQGFFFEKATLQQFCEDDPAQEGYPQVYYSKYTGAELKLTSSGPWSKWTKKKQLRATGIEAGRCSYLDIGGYAFVLHSCGKFDDEDIWFHLMLRYDGFPYENCSGGDGQLLHASTEILVIILISSTTPLSCDTLPECSCVNQINP
jgi:hypothetical protein